MKDKIIDFLKGCAIGIAMIIPGVSGGTLAVLLNIYDKMIYAISSLRKEFKKSFFYLLPIVLGIVVAFAAMYYPLKLALQYIPFQTTMVFLGLMAGSTPKIVMDASKNGFKPLNILSFIIPLSIVIGICFIPGLSNVDLSSSMPTYQYFLIVLIAILASCALVVPGISGSMLLLILGYYQPVLNLFSELKTNTWHALLLLVLFAIGIVIGFLTIAKLMKYLLNKFKRGTNWAIVGFVIGSLPALLIQFDYSSTSMDAFTIGISVFLCLVMGIASFFFTKYIDKKINSKQENNTLEVESENK